MGDRSTVMRALCGRCGLKFLGSEDENRDSEPGPHGWLYQEGHRFYKYHSLASITWLRELDGRPIRRSRLGCAGIPWGL